VNKSSITIAQEIEGFFEEQAAQFRARGIEAHASLMVSADDQATVGLEVFGEREDAELTIDVSPRPAGFEIDGAIIGGNGRRVRSFEPVTTRAAGATDEALRIAKLGSQVLFDRFSLQTAH
jgi:hypothetical protein